MTEPQLRLLRTAVEHPDGMVLVEKGAIGRAATALALSKRGFLAYVAGLRKPHGYEVWAVTEAGREAVRRETLPREPGCNLPIM